MTHRHLSHSVRWNWATDRIEHYCACGLKLADEVDEASYGPPFGVSVEKLGSSTDRECGQSWLVDLARGIVMFAGAFLLFLAALLLLA